MRDASLSCRILVSIALFTLVYTLKAQDFSAGVNTETPNPNAVLHLVAPNGDQGLLIPTLTTVQRIGMTLGVADNGLLVFDTTDGLFYYYFGGWIALTTSGTELDGDPGNELITAGTLVGNTLTITEAGIDHDIDLSAFASAPQDLQFAGNLLSITGDPTPTTVDFSTWDQNAADDLTTADVGIAANQIVQLDGAGALPPVDGSNLTGILSTVTTDGTTIVGDGAGTPLAVGTLPAAQVSGLAAVATTGSFGDLLLQPVGLADGDDVGVADGVTVLGDGVGTPYSVNVGTAANQILQLDGGGALPAVDGSALTGITPTLGAGSVTTTEILDATIADIDVSGTANIAATKLQTNVMLETENISLLTNDVGYLDVVTTDITLVGDGTAGTPLSLNRVNPAIITGGGAIAGQILEFDGTNWVPAVDDIALADGVTILGNGGGTPYEVNVGTGANQIVRLNGTAQIPAVDGSLLTNVSASTLAVDAVTSAAISNGTIVDADVSGTANIAASKLETTVMLETENVSLLNNDAGYLVTVTSDATLNGDGTAGTPLGVNVGTGPDQIVQLNASGQLPAVDGSLLTLVVADSVKTNTAPITGDVLTYDGITWDAAPSTGLTLPYSQTVADAGNLFALTNSGLGGSGFFEINNGVSIANALNASTNGTGSALSVAHAGAGVGVGVNVSMTQATSTGPALSLNHAGLGAGIEINTTSGPPLMIPGGALGEVLTSDALGNITLQPGGLTLPYTQTVTNAGDLFYLVNDGAGGAGAFQVLNGASTATALSANTNGAGSAILASHTGATGSAMNIDVTGAANPDAGLFINHGGTGSGIEISTASGPNMILNGPTPFQIPSGAVLGHVLTSVDAAGNTVWAPPLTLPYSNTVADPGTLFDITNSGAGAAASFTSTGIAALFSTTGATSAIQVDGDIEFLEGADRFLGIPTSTTGAGDLLTVISGAAGGVGGNGGDLNLRSGDAFTAGDGGNIIIAPGTGAGGGNFGQVLVNGTTRFGNPNAGFGGSIELEDDGGANAVAIQADPLTTAYSMTLPTANASGVLTNDGAGILTWAPSGITFPSSTIQTDADTLFNLTNTGTAPAAGFAAFGLAATFSNLVGGTAVQVVGNMEFLDGAPRDFGILPNLAGPGDILNVYSGDAAGPGGDGGDLVLSSGLGAGVGNGGDILLVPGAGAGGGFTGGVFVNGITRFGNPNVGFGGLLELENDAGTFSIGIEADPTMAADYTIRLPNAQGSGALTNDGAGTLSWSPAGFTAPYYDDISNVVFGTTTPASILASPNFQLGSVAPSGQASLSGSSHGIQTRVPLLRANGIEGAELALQAADVIGELAFVGYDGTGYFRQGMIRGFATENWTGATRGTALSFFATPAGNIPEREVLRISGVGLQVNGVARLNNPIPGLGGSIELEDDGGANSFRISADPTSATYEIIFPAAQGTGALTNDGFGNLTWNPAGFTAPLFENATNVVFGSATPILNVPAPDFQLGAVAPSGQVQLTGASFGLQSQVTLIRGNGTQAAPTSIIIGDVIGETAFVGYDGANYFRQGMIRGVATENWTGATRGTALSFSTTPIGTTIDQEVMRIFGDSIKIFSTPKISSTSGGAGAAIDLENEAGGNYLSIQAERFTDSYKIIFPATQGTGSLTNDGSGNLSWVPGNGGFILDANANLLGNTTIPSATTAKDNFLAGSGAGLGLTTGSDNVFIGRTSGTAVQGGFFNVGIGLNAGSALTSGGDNVLLGQNAGISLTTGVQNIAIGSSSDILDNVNPDNVAIGFSSTASGGSSTAIGAGAAATGVNSVAIGAGVNVAQDFTAVIGDPSIPTLVGIGTVTPASKLEVETLSTENIDLMTLNHGGFGGRALVINVPVGGSPDPAMLIAQNSTGAGIDARITNSASNATLITAQHQGDGNVAFFNQGNNLSGADAMFVQTLGLGAAGVFQISNTGSTAPALAVNTDGDNSNAIAVTKTGLNGAGIAIDMNNQGSNGLFIGGTQAGVASISTDGDINTTTDFNGNNLNLVGTATIGRNFVTPSLNYDVGGSGPVLPNTNRVLRLINLTDINIDEITVAGAFDGQEILLIVEAAGSTFDVNSGTVNIRLNNNNPFTMQTGSSLHMMYIEPLNQWVEIGRSF